MAKKKISISEDEKMKFELKNGLLSKAAAPIDVQPTEETLPPPPKPIYTQPGPVYADPAPQINRQAQIMAQMKQQDDALRQQMMAQAAAQQQEQMQQQEEENNVKLIIHLTEGQAMQEITIPLDTLTATLAQLDKVIVEQTIFKFGTHTINALYIKRYEIQ
jgi:hypothetical protein